MLKSSQFKDPKSSTPFDKSSTEWNNQFGALTPFDDKIMQKFKLDQLFRNVFVPNCGIHILRKNMSLISKYIWMNANEARVFSTLAN
jgi:hypothetical protein